MESSINTMGSKGEVYQQVPGWTEKAPVPPPPPRPLKLGDVNWQQGNFSVGNADTYSRAAAAPPPPPPPPSGPDIQHDYLIKRMGAGATLGDLIDRA